MPNPRSISMRAKLVIAGLAVAGLVAGGGVALASTSPSSVFVPVTPTRVLDTRLSGGPVAAHGSITFNPGEPAGATAVSLNVTVVSPTQGGNVTVDPSGLSGATGTSNDNFAAGQTTANGVTTQVGTDGQVTVYNQSAGTLQLVVDMEGYYKPGGSTTTFYDVYMTGPGPSVVASCTAYDIATGGGGQAGNTGQDATWSRPTTVTTTNDSWAAGSVGGVGPVTAYVVCEHTS
jgi:hypothetical protein